MADSWLELSAVAEPEAADAVAEVFGRWGRGVAIEQPVRDAPDGDGGWVDPHRNVVVKTYLALNEEAEQPAPWLRKTGPRPGNGSSIPIGSAADW